MENKFVSCYFFRLKDMESKKYYCRLHKDLESIKDLSETKKLVGGDFVKIYRSKFHQDTKLLEMQILRYRNSILPGEVDDKTNEFELITVGKGKQLAEFTTVIYDFENACILLHNNFHGLTHKMLENYLNLLLFDLEKKYSIELEVILSGIRLSDIKNREGVIYKRIDFSIDTTNINDDNIISFLKNINATDAKTITMSLSVGRAKKEKGLNKIEIDKYLDSVDNKSEDWNSFKLAYRKNKDEATEIIDLIENKLVTGFEFTYDKSTPITHERIYDFFEKDYRKIYKNKKPVKISVER